MAFATYDLPLISIEEVSAVICYILVWFMAKPCRVTGESRYLGLPLGFTFLGASYFLAAVTAYFASFSFAEEMKLVQVFTQTYAFLFLVSSYYFSKEPSKRSRFWWTLTNLVLLTAVIASYLIVIEHPMIALPSYKNANEFLLSVSIICLAYISVHTLRSHAKRPDSTTVLIPISYLLLGFGQCSLLLWYIDSCFSAYAGAHVLELSGLMVLLFVAYQSFYPSHGTGQKEKGKMVVQSTQKS